MPPGQKYNANCGMVIIFSPLFNFYYLVTADFPDTESTFDAYDLFVKVFEDGTLNDEFEGFKVFRRVHALHALKVFIICEAYSYIPMSKHFAP